MTDKSLVLIPFPIADRNSRGQVVSTKDAGSDPVILRFPQSPPSPTHPIRVFLECSETASNNIRTGIQRVIRNIILHHQEAAQEVGVEAHAARFAAGSFYEFRWTPAKDSNEMSAEEKWKERLSRLLGDRLGTLCSASVCRLAARVKKMFRFRSLRRKIELACIRRFASPLEPRPGDLLVLLDSTWKMPLWPAIQRWREQGGKVVFGIHDILPITHPHFFQPKVVPVFTRWFDQVVRNTDFLLAVSDAVRDQLRKLVASGNLIHANNSLRIESFREGADLDMLNHNAPVRSQVRQAVDSPPGTAPYLVVGTVEPRKNHRVVLDAFNRLWAAGHKVKLVIVGRRGWHCDDVVERIQTHPRWGKDLFWFSDLSDSELHFCYENAKALVFASFAEGFGLPIVEGLQHGLPVIASDLPVHREVAGNFAAFFDPQRAETLVAMVAHLETQGSLPSVQSANVYRVFTWREAVTGLLRLCRNLMDEKADRVEYKRVSRLRRAA